MRSRRSIPSPAGRSIATAAASHSAKEQRRSCSRPTRTPALGEGLLPPTVNLRHLDPAWDDLDLVPEAGRRAPLAVAVSSSYGFGGHNVSLVLGRMAR